MVPNTSYLKNPTQPLVRVMGGLPLFMAITGIAVLVESLRRRAGMIGRAARGSGWVTGIGILVVPRPAHAMHLAEGILPLYWAALWYLVALPFVAVALRLLQRRARHDPFYKPFVGMVAAAVFLVSCMPVPVPTAGTCSHPCGTGLAAILIGPWMTILVTVVALLLQALFMAHGGLTTLGADVASMGIAGAFVGWAAYYSLRRVGASLWVAAFAAGLLSDWATYAVTSVELASALHGERPFGAVLSTVALAFVPTQLPLGILEGFLSAGAISFLYRRRRDILERLAVVPYPTAIPLSGLAQGLDA